MLIITLSVKLGTAGDYGLSWWWPLSLCICRVFSYVGGACGFLSCLMLLCLVCHYLCSSFVTLSFRGFTKVVSL
jgi:hypothetical protein